MTSYIGKMNNSIKVSICCLAYNHEKYIESAIESFLHQETNFMYEILIHDDASTDNTKNIIEKYREKYPEIIKTIIQTENQYSKGGGISVRFLYPKANGKYIAICEGDDYWTDPLKLQKQVDYMENNKNCTLCFTNGWIEDVQNNNIRSVFFPFSQEDASYYCEGNAIVSLENFYQYSFVPTASLLFRKSDLERLPKSFYNRCPNGDLKTRLYLTSLGYSYFIDEKTCVYRKNVSGSVMTSWGMENKHKKFNRSESVVKMICDVDEFTNYSYSDCLFNIKQKYLMSMLLNAPDFNVFANDECKTVFLSCDLINKIRIILKIIIPEFLYPLFRAK